MNLADTALRSDSLSLLGKARGIEHQLDLLSSPLKTERAVAVALLGASDDLRASRALEGVAAEDESIRVRFMAKKSL